MSLRSIVGALGGDLYDNGRRASVPAPGHSRHDRSVSLLLTGGRVVVHTFNGGDWRDVLDELRRRGLIDRQGAPAGGAVDREPQGADSPLPLQRAQAAATHWQGGLRFPGSLSERYVRMRGVRRPVRSESLRHHPAMPLAAYRPGRRSMPALLTAIHAPDGRLTALEVTYLEPTGARASGLRLPRKTIGVLEPGSAIRIDPAEPAMIIAEGLLTALSASEVFGLPAWAAMSTTNLRRWAPPDGVRRVLIAADRGPGGEASAELLRRRLAAVGLAASVRLPPAGFGDWNDAAGPQS